jgi:hypothetical protein
MPQENGLGIILCIGNIGLPQLGLGGVRWFPGMNVETRLAMNYDFHRQWDIFLM